MFSKFSESSNSQTHSFAQESARQKRLQESLIDCENVSLIYPECRAIQNIQLSIGHGEVVFITGASGAGKTTLLKIISGELSPSQGKISYGMRTKDFFQAQVFQDQRLISELSIRDNLDVSFDNFHYSSKSDFEADLNQIARILGIENKLQLKAARANGGLKQKVCIARALLTRPSLLLLDEPTQSLDRESSLRIFDLINFYNNKRKTTVIWASHNRDLVKGFPGRIIHLNMGKLVHTGHACFI